MNDSFPPLGLTSPQIAPRRPESGGIPPISQEIFARRQEIARTLEQKITPLSSALRQMSDSERKAVFYKLEHEGIPPLAGTDLKALVEQSEHFTLAIPRTDNLDTLVNKVCLFGEGQVRNGHAPSERLAATLKDIRRGEPKDRLCQDIFERYNDIVRQEWVICEIEMVSLLVGRRKQAAELQQFREDIARAFSGGVYGNFFEHEDIKGTCRAVIRCSGSLFKQFVEGSEWQRKISWFDARPEFETFHSILRDFSVENLGGFEEPDDIAPIVCIVDSGLTFGNPFLNPVSREELLKSFLGISPDNPYDEYGHGSGVASLAAYYALNLQAGASNSGKVWVASARVLDADNRAEEDRLFSKVLAEVVDFFVPLGVRVFNLSVNILNRKWNEEARRTISRRSWIARTIDQLSREKDIVFVVSTGNITAEQVRDYLQNDQQYPDYFLDEDARILDPGQAALALTVGSIAPGTLSVGPSGSALAIAAKNQPAPFTRCGPGISREIKPELVEYGGNYLHDVGGNIVRTNPGTNVMMASNQLTPAVYHDSGTSFAAPRVTHKLGLILSDLQTLGVNPISAPLLKAFIVNSARWSTLGDEFNEFVESLGAKHGLNVAGHGMPDHNFATHCDAHSAVLFFQGYLSPNMVAYFEVPVPAVLANTGNGSKRLTVTVVHSPEVQRWGLERYLGTTMKWRMFRGDRSQEDIIAAMSVEDNDDSEAPERPCELGGNIGIMLRSRGTIQHDVIEWKRHREAYSTGHYTLAIAAYEKWGRTKLPKVPFAVVIRLEDTTHTTQVYSEVQHILTEIEIQARTRA